jgi:heme exporter protein A
VPGGGERSEPMEGGGHGSSADRAGGKAPRGIARVEITKVAKRYGTERALAGVTLELRAGSMCALLGVVSTLVRPNGGEVTYVGGGGKLTGEAVRREIGMLAHASLCYGELTAIENLELFAGLYELPGASAAITAVLDKVGLEPRARTRAARTYSRGMVQRLALARALLTRPSLLLLDEPFTGLDRGGALALGEQLGELKAAGAIVVVVTHDLEAIAGRADHVAILRRGALVFEERAETYSYDQLKEIYHRHAN